MNPVLLRVESQTIEVRLSDVLGTLWSLLTARRRPLAVFFRTTSGQIVQLPRRGS